MFEVYVIEEKVVDGYKFGFKFDKLDEFGWKFILKEVFREFCYCFYGIEFGKMKREKCLR